MGKRSDSRIRFTKQVVDRIDAPATGRKYVYDETVNGLAICVTDAGSKTWYLCRRICGRSERVRLGPFPIVTVEQAREAAEALIGEAAAGGNPIKALRSTRKGLTVEQLWERFRESPARLRAKRERAASTRRSYGSYYRNSVSLLAQRRVNALTRSEIERWHDRIGTSRGYAAANKALDLLRAMFEFAIDRDITTANPAARVRKYATQSRERFLQPDEVSRFLQAVELQRPIVRDWVLLALYTAQRRSSVDAMRWDDIDLATATWNIPHTKTGRHSVPLIPPAVEILQRRLVTRNGCEWVFPGIRRKTHIRMQFFLWEPIVKAAGLENLRIHDLRRSLASWMARGGTSLPTIGKALGHSQPSTTAIYARLDDAPVREAMDAAAQSILATRSTAKNAAQADTSGS